MLGHVVARYLNEQGCAVATIETRFNPAKPEEFVGQILAVDPEWCINCVGLKPGAAAASAELFNINALLPQLCSRALQGKVRFLQPSTDGVFRPDRKDRRISEACDATDDYGIAKRSAEESVIQAGGTVIRCSIVGPELGEPRSLLGWLSRQSGEVQGYINHFWNGITTLEWAKLCRELITRESGTAEQIIQPGTWPAISKYDLLRLIARVWELPVKIKPVEARTAVARTLVPTLECAGLEEQLRELKSWYASKTPRS